jgi:hypothetical protein
VSDEIIKSTTKDGDFVIRLAKKAPYELCCNWEGEIKRMLLDRDKATGEIYPQNTEATFPDLWDFVKTNCTKPAREKLFEPL